MHPQRVLCIWDFSSVQEQAETGADEDDYSVILALELAALETVSVKWKVGVSYLVGVEDLKRLERSHWGARLILRCFGERKSHGGHCRALPRRYCWQCLSIRVFVVVLLWLRFLRTGCIMQITKRGYGYEQVAYILCKYKSSRERADEWKIYLCTKQKRLARYVLTVSELELHIVAGIDCMSILRIHGR